MTHSFKLSSPFLSKRIGAPVDEVEDWIISLPRLSEMYSQSTCNSTYERLYSGLNGGAPAVFKAKSWDPCSSKVFATFSENTFVKSKYSERIVIGSVLKMLLSTISEITRTNI